MQTTVISLLDKEYPPEHSFIDGLLSSLLAKQKDINMVMIISKGAADKRVCKYNNSIVIPILAERKGINRFLNIFTVIPLLHKIIKKHRAKKHRIVLFVRNEPVYLLAAKILRKSFDKLIYQQSFPHEQATKNLFKKYIAIALIKFMNKRVDAITAVSPDGLNRLSNFFYKDIRGLVIPLLSSKNERTTYEEMISNSINNGRVRFVYIGAHDKLRQIDVIIRSIVKAFSYGIDAEFTFIGGKQEEIETLRLIPGVQELETAKKLIFRGKISRSILINELPHYQVGLTLIPPIELYKESSPTKLSEYMNAGLAVMASKGIRLQEQILMESKGGVLVDWSEKGITEAIILLIKENMVDLMRANALKYAKEKLDYEYYLDEFRGIL